MSPETIPVGLLTSILDMLAVPELFEIALPLCSICPHELKPKKPMHTRKIVFLTKEMDPFDNRLKIVEELFVEKNVLL
jgi:hypothetical protein